MFYPVSPSPGGVIFLVVFVLRWLQFVWFSYLRFRQWKAYNEQIQKPYSLAKVLELEVFEKTRCESRKQLKVMYLKDVYQHFKVVIMMLTLKYIWNISGDALRKEGLEASEMHRVLPLIMIWIGADNLFNLILAFLVKIKETNANLKEKFIRTIKLALGKIIQTLGTTILVYTISIIILKLLEWSGVYFGYMALWVVIILLKVTIPLLGTCFMPLTDIPKGSLKSELENLLKQEKFPVEYLYLIRNEKSSQAFFYGFGTCKCIVLSEGLVNSTIDCRKLDARNKIVTDGNSTLNQIDKYPSDKGLLRNTTSHFLNHLIGFILNGSFLPNDLKFDFVTENNRKDIKNRCRECKKSVNGMCNKHAVTHIRSLYTIDEVIGIVGHELGHWKRGHVILKVCLSVAKISALILVLAILNTQDAIYEAFNFEEEKPILIGFIITYKFILEIFISIFSVAQKSIERYFEYQADSYATEIGLRNDLCKALIKIHMENFIYPKDDFLHTAWFKSHPSLFQRLDALQDKDTWKNTENGQIN